MTALVLGDPEKVKIADLRERASQNPVDVKWLLNWIKDPDIKARHMAQMSSQTMLIPMNFMVTYSIETGHPAGVCRHMSMSLDKKGYCPSPYAVWMVAEEFGFVGGLVQCSVWEEELQGHGMSVNVVQPLAVVV
jgi:hypothetical protein